MRASTWIVAGLVGGIGVLTPRAEAAGLTATFTTTPAGGTYAPRNVVAVWVEGPGGTIEKTIGRWSAVRTSNLVGWVGKAGANDADAVSGATRANHTTPLTVTWDLKDRQGQAIAPGTYTLRMELADTNTSTTTPNHEGTFTFVYGTAAQDQANLSNGGFTAVTIHVDAAGSTTTPPPDPPPSGGGGSGSGSGSGDPDPTMDPADDGAIEGGCSAGGGGAGLAVIAIGIGAAISGSSRRARGRTGSR
jgi:hypothetical protein